MLDNTTPVSDDVAAGMKRRTILAGAAWSVPVIAVATASPAFAATAACPNVSDTSKWTEGNNGYIQYGGSIRNVDGRNAFYVYGDNNTAKNSGLIGRTWIKTTIQVTKGQTLNFSYEAFGNYGNFDKSKSAPSTTNIYINDSNISDTYGTQTDKYGSVQLPIKEKSTDSNPWKQYSTSWTATETTSVELKIEVAVYPQNDSQSANDDITISLPTISCS